MSAVLSTETAAVKIKGIEDLHPVLMSMKEAVILDIETTGFSLDKFSEIIEIGALKVDVETKCVTGHFSQLIRPSNAFSIPSQITDLTSISWAQVEDKPYLEEVLPVFARFLGDAPVVAHNAQFDWPRFLVPCFRKVGLIATNEAICTMNLAKHLYPDRGRGGYSLEALCEMFGHQMEGHHRACMDCRWTASIFLRMVEEYRSRHSLSEQTSLSPLDEVTPLPSEVGFVCLDDLRITRVSGDKGPSPKHGPRIYVSTNFGRICYSVRRRLWTVVDLWVDRNLPAQVWGRRILSLLGVDAETFVQTYAPGQR